MDRSGSPRAFGVFFALLIGALPLALVAALRAQAPLDLDGGELPWLGGALAAGLAVVSALAALAALVAGLRRRSPSAVLEAGSSAALAGAAIGMLAGAGSMPVAMAGVALFLLAAAIVRARGTETTAWLGTGTAIGVMIVAEALVLVDLLPATLALLAPLRQLLLIAAMAAAGVSVLVSHGRRATAGALVTAGAGALLADRGGSFETLIGMAALAAGQLVVLTAMLEPETADADDEEDRLPELASRLTDAVLRFDGHLRLRDWNASAASLLGLDAASAGTRIEDLLGVSVAELPGPDGAVVSHRVVGGLEVAMHRSGSGVTTVIRDPGAPPEAERLGLELRATIEELLRARRTIDLQRGELERSSTVDPLTGVASRGAILERLRIEIAQARRYRHPLAVVLIDVDGFGRLNRAHGVTGGDSVLREVALRIRLRVREADALGRAGSDGFIAVLPHTDEAGAATFADALRHRLSLRPISVGDESVSVSVSIGVATMRPAEDLDLDGVLARVQEALDSARTAGGDRIALDRLHGLARLEDPHDVKPPSDPAESGTA